MTEELMIDNRKLTGELSTKKEYSITLNIMNSIVCSNMNRVCILHLLRNSEKSEMQAEKIAYSLGISHRTVLYHLDILHECGFVEVRKYKIKGKKMIRSVWGLKDKNKKHLETIFSKIKGDFDCSELDSMTKKNKIPR